MDAPAPLGHKNPQNRHLGNRIANYVRRDRTVTFECSIYVNRQRIIETDRAPQSDGAIIYAICRAVWVRRNKDPSDQDTRS